MQLPFLNKNKKTDHYLGLLLKENQGIVIVISAKIEKAEVVDFEKFDYSNSWENVTEDIDEVLYRLETKHKIRLEETIFFIYSHLIDEKTNQIKKIYQQKVKNIVKDLELKPLGFIDCREAVVKTLEKKDENKLTGIVVELDKNNLAVFIYKTGQIVFAKLVLRTENIVDDLTQVFDEIKGKILLPTRIILYNSKELDFEVTKIVSQRWSTDLFIQLPRVEIVQEKDIIHNLVSLFKQQIKIEKVDDGLKNEETIAGFVIGQDIKNSKQQIISEKKIPDSSKVRNFFNKIHFPKMNALFIKSQCQKKIFLILGSVILLLGLFLNEYFLHKVKIQIFVPSENLKKNLNISAGEGEDVDLTLKSTKKVWDISSSKMASGKKNIGDAASGEVTLYNFSKETTFSKGTKIETKGFSFSLDDEVKVASASLTTDGSAKLPGKAKVKITAVEIGADSNLVKGQTFKIEELDPEVYFAKNESDFSGGSQKQITTVSEKDIDDLDTDVVNKAKKEKISNFNLKPEEKIISQLTTTEIAEKNYSKEVGEEANSVTLTAKVETTVYTYKKTTLLDFLYKKLVVEMRPKFSLDKNKISYQVEDVEENKKITNLEISAEGKAIKTINKDEVIKKLIGKSKGSVENILKSSFDIEGYQSTQVQPLAIPFYKNVFPFFRKNFEVEISSL